MQLKQSSQTILIILRIAIGWHFLHEGVTKLLKPGWSCVLYLLDSQGPVSGIFHAMAKNPVIVSGSDWLNMVGLTLIGLCLVIGLFERPALIGGVILLAFYYLSHPPFIGMSFAMPTEGSYLLVDKNLVELIAMLLLYTLPTSQYFGLKRLLPKSLGKFGI